MIKKYIVLFSIINFMLSSLICMQEDKPSLSKEVEEQVNLYGLIQKAQGIYYHILQGEKTERSLMKGGMHDPSDLFVAFLERDSYSKAEDGGGEKTWNDTKKNNVPRMIETYKLFINPQKDKVEKVSCAFLKALAELPILQKNIAQFKILADNIQMDEGFPALVIYPTIGKKNVEELFDALSILFPTKKIASFERKLDYVDIHPNAQCLSGNQGEYPDKKDFESYFDAQKFYFKKNCDPDQNDKVKSPYALGRSYITRYKEYALYGLGFGALTAFEFYSLRNKQFGENFLGLHYREICLGLISLTTTFSSLAWYQAIRGFRINRALTYYASKLNFD